MVIVEFLGPINKDSIEVDVANIGELSDLLKKDTSLTKWLGMCAVAVNDNIVNSKDFALKDGDRVALLPPVCGG